MFRHAMSLAWKKIVSVTLTVVLAIVDSIPDSGQVETVTVYSFRRTEGGRKGA